MTSGNRHVYLIESECGRVKVGNSEAPEKRLATFAANSPRPLRLIAIWPGSWPDEIEIHRRFSEYRSHNEWFRPEGAFAAFVEDHRGLGVPSVPEWASLDWAAVKRRASLARSAAQRAIRSNPTWKAQQAARRAWCRSVDAAEAALGRALSTRERADRYHEFQSELERAA